MSKKYNGKIVQLTIDLVDYFVGKLDELYQRYGLTGSITWKVGK